MLKKEGDSSSDYILEGDRQEGSELSDLEAQFRAQELRKYINLAEHKTGVSLNLQCLQRLDKTYGPIVISSKDLKLEFGNPQEVILKESQLKELRLIESNIREFVDLYSERGGVPINYDRTMTSLEDE